MSSQVPNATRWFPHDRLQPLEDLESKNTERNESVTCRFCQGSEEVVENLRTWFHLDVPVAERNLSDALNKFCISDGEKQGICDKSCIILQLAFELSVGVTQQPQILNTWNKSFELTINL